MSLRELILDDNARIFSNPDQFAQTRQFRFNNGEGGFAAERGQ